MVPSGSAFFPCCRNDCFFIFGSHQFDYNVVRCYFFFYFSCLGILWASWICLLSNTNFGKILIHYLIKYFCRLVLSSSSFWYSNYIYLILSPNLLVFWVFVLLFVFLPTLFSLRLSIWINSVYLSSSSLIPPRVMSSCLISLLKTYFNSDTVFFYFWNFYLTAFCMFHLFAKIVHLLTQAVYCFC